MRLTRLIVAVIVAAFAAALPAKAEPAALGLTISTITTDGFTSAAADFEAVHTVSDGVADGGVSHEDSWVARFKVRTADGREVTCSGNVDAAHSSESPSRGTDHIVVDLTAAGANCGHADLTFIIGDDPPVVSASPDGTRGFLSAGGVVIVLDGAAEAERAGTASGTIHSPFFDSAVTVPAFMKNSRKAKTSEAVNLI